MAAQLKARPVHDENSDLQLGKLGNVVRLEFVLNPLGNVVFIDGAFGGAGEIFD